MRVQDSREILRSLRSCPLESRSPQEPRAAPAVTLKTVGHGAADS